MNCATNDREGWERVERRADEKAKEKKELLIQNINT